MNDFFETSSQELNQEHLVDTQSRLSIAQPLAKGRVGCSPRAAVAFSALSGCSWLGRKVGAVARRIKIDRTSI